MTAGFTIVLTLGAFLLTAADAWGDAYQIGPLSQREGPGQAAIGASIQVSGSSPGSSAGQGSPSAPPSHASSSSGPAIPTLPSNSPLFANTTPAGPGSFWYPLGTQRCIYTPNGVAPCFNVVTPGASAGPAAPAINPAAIAASVARRLSLGPGRIEASPSARVDGLTGAASWFWLSPPPSTRSLSVSLRGERVTVTASPRNVDWAFGDGRSVVAGAGIPYRPGPAPSGAVRHEYQTRCLPGDQGHDPYVLASCGADGYAVSASLAWGFSFMATGPVSASGRLLARATSTSLAYPVSEARGFLIAGGE